MTSIRDTALAALGGRIPRGTGTQAQSVLDALEGREREMFGEIVEAGVGLGANRDTVHQLLVDVGMTAPVVEAVVAGGGGGDDERLAALEARVDKALKRAGKAMKALRKALD